MNAGTPSWRRLGRIWRALRMLFLPRLAPLSLDDVLPLLIDPDSREALRRGGPHTLVAAGARRAFPLLDGIPRLMRERARPAADDECTASPPAQPARPAAAVMVLDVGTKTGEGIVRIRGEHSAQLGVDLRASWGVVGIDLQHSRLLEAKKHGIFAIEADGARMPFADGSFDLTVITELLEHVPRDVAVDVMKEARRVTRGSVFIQNPDFTSEPYLHANGLKFTWMDWKVHPHHITADGMRAILEEAGFTGFEVEQRYPVRDSAHAELVSSDAPRDTQRFDPAVHQKPRVTFERPVFEKLQVVLDTKAHCARRAESA